ncbi:hypothetical protein D1AOALGA4SA_5654 [Olavius algarvensis Delta 1 endosymbiont]|nr:hypothetical protein D1AOALGA4SA_5654 [Olavius algarvensis Delta 1 endosymbiont]
MGQVRANRYATSLTIYGFRCQVSGVRKKPFLSPEHCW